MMKAQTHKKISAYGNDKSTKAQKCVYWNDESAKAQKDMCIWE